MYVLLTIPLEESSLRDPSEPDEDSDEDEGVLVVLGPQLHGVVDTAVKMQWMVISQEELHQLLESFHSHPSTSCKASDVIAIHRVSSMGHVSVLNMEMHRSP